MKIEDMNFEPHRGFAIFMIGLSVVFTLVFGTVAVVNVYRQLRDPSSLGDVFGWLATSAVTCACVVLLLYYTTAVYRISFYEAGVVTLGFGGRRFVPWDTVRGASINRFKGTVELALRADGRRFPVSVPLTSYRRSATLFREVSKRLPVEINDPNNIASLLTDN
ncbi:MAG TPA: hypothetical protein VF527_00040 [Pyrinomonadaceae bacterium]|jgi:hypothetical protein